MTETANGPGGGSALTKFLLEALVLLALLAGSFLVLDAVWALIFGVVVTLAYATGGSALAARGAAGSGPSPLAAAGCGLMHLTGGTVLAGGLSVFVITGWIGWAYEPSSGGDQPLDALFPSLPGLVFGLIASFLVAAATIVASLALLKGEDEGNAVFFRRILGDDAGTVLLAAVVASLLGLAVTGVINVGSTLTGVIPIMENQNPHRSVPIWEVAAAFPVLPVMLIAIAAMLAAYRKLSPVLFGRVRGNAASPPGGARPVWWLTPVAGAAASIGGLVYIVHLGFVAALGIVVEISPAMAAIDGLDNWVAEQRAEGRAGVEIVTALEQNGEWSSEAPDGGLIALIPELASDDAEGILESACRFRVVAGIADTAQVEGIDWLDTAQATSDVKYCLAIACPSPVTWDAPPALILHSSHASRNAYWAGNLFMDVFAEGVAKPGGYCTAVGGLAENFQG